MPRRSGVENFRIPAVLTAAVPQTVGYQHLSLGGSAKIADGAQIGIEGKAVGLCRLQGDIYLVQTRAVLEQRVLAQQGAVGGKNHPEPGFPRQSHESLHLGVTQWLSHEMKIEEV